MCTSFVVPNCCIFPTQFYFDVLISVYLFCLLSIANFCSVDHASRYIRINKTNLMHYLSSAYFVNQPLRVSGIFVAHRQEVDCILYIHSNWYVLC